MQIMSLLVAGLIASLLPSMAAAETPKRGGMRTFAIPTQFTNQDPANVWLDP